MGKNVIRLNEMIWNEACLGINFMYFYASGNRSCYQFVFLNLKQDTATLFDVIFHYLSKKKILDCILLYTMKLSL